MPTNVILPALGMAQDTGKILEWLKAEGATVRQGEALAVIETDKATLDLEAPAAGILAQVAAPAGAEVPVGHVIALILSPEEAAVGGDARALPPLTPTEPGPSGQRSVAGASAPTPDQQTPLGVTAPNGRPVASPKARRVAREQGLDLAALHGSGPGGAVLTADVLAASGPVILAPSVTAAQATDDALAMSNIWRIMAERTTSAWSTTPHIFLAREVNASELRRWHDQIRARNSEPITITDLLIKVIADALTCHPRLNAAWRQGATMPNAAINIGLAIATEDGLVVPVIHQADSLSVPEIATWRRDVIERAQRGRLHPRDLEAGTFTISNLGMYGIDAFTAIINGGQAAILAVGRVADRVVPFHGQPVIQPMCTLTLSCDHRVVDGARGAAFMATLADLIEQRRE